MNSVFTVISKIEIISSSQTLKEKRKAYQNESGTHLGAWALGLNSSNSRILIPPGTWPLIWLSVGSSWLCQREEGTGLCGQLRFINVFEREGFGVEKGARGALAGSLGLERWRV